MEFEEKREEVVLYYFPTFLTKRHGKPSRPGALSFGRAKTADLISSIMNSHSNHVADYLEIVFSSLSNNAVGEGIFE